MVKHALVIYNPVSKAQVSSEDWIGQLVAELNKADEYVVSFFPTTAETTPDDLIPLIEDSLDLIIAGGGDGTLRFALAAVAKAKSAVPVAIFPMGTGNVMARNIGIVEQNLLADPLEKAFDYITNGRPMRIDMGMMNGEYFAGMAGVGPISDAFMLPAREEKTQSKLKAYFKSLLTSIAMPRRTWKITTSGGTFRVQASGVFLTNVEDLGIGKAADVGLLRDGLLDLHIINPVCLGDYIRLAKRYAAGDLAQNPSDMLFRVKEAVVEVVPRRGVRSTFQSFVKKAIELLTGKKIATPERSHQLPCMIDGDVYGVTPMRVTVIPGAVNLLVPKELHEEQQQLEQASEFEDAFVKAPLRSVPNDVSVIRSNDRAAS